MSLEFEYAADYASRGWRVIRTWGCREGDGGKLVCCCSRGPSCPTPGKHPVDWSWQKIASADEETVATWFDVEHPPNVSVVLGQKSGIIDIEWDGDEGKASAVKYGLVGCETPTYVSSRSEHRIFAYDPRLPQQGVYKIGGLEVRIGGGERGAQSVFPPSLHASGIRYEWKKGLDPSSAAVAPVPEAMLAAILNATSGVAAAPKEPARALLHRKCGEGERHSMLVRMAASLCLKMADVHDPVEQQDVLVMLRSLNATQCVPPQTPDEVETIWRSELRWAIKVRATDCDRKKALDAHSAGEEQEEAVAAEAMADTPFTLTGLEYRDGEWWPGRWSLAVLNGDPVAYVLTIPTFGEGGDRQIEVTMDAACYRSASRVAHAVLEATQTVILDEVPEDWYLIWNGCGRRKKRPAIRGLKAKLMDVATRKEATAEHRRYAHVAEWFLQALTTTPPPSEEVAGAPDSHGTPAWVRGRDGVWELWFSWGRVWESVDRGRRKIQDGDQLGLKRRIMAITGEQRLPSGRHVSEGGVNRRYIRFTEKHLRALEHLASGEPSPITHEERERANSEKAPGNVENWTDSPQVVP